VLCDVFGKINGLGVDLRLLRFCIFWVSSLPSDVALGIGYRLIRRIRRLYFLLGIPGRLIAGRGK
jgi:hypothetical protein